MRKRLFRYITMALSLWIFLGGSIGQVYAQDEFNPTPPPEPGKLTLLLSTDPHGSAYLEQTNPSGIYDTGTEVTVRAYPHTDYEFVAWQSADGEELSGLSEYTFTLTEKNARLIAQLRFNPKENPSEMCIRDRFKGAYDGHYKNLRMGIERIIYPNCATDYRPEDNLQTIRVPSVASITRSKGLRMDKR